MVVSIVRATESVLDRVESHVRLHKPETDQRGGHWPPRVAVLCLTTAHSNLPPVIPSNFFERKNRTIFHEQLVNSSDLHISIQPFFLRTKYIPSFPY